MGLRAFAAASVFACPLAMAQDGPRARSVHHVFTTSEQCAACHLTAPGSTAMQTADGEDVSPYWLWQGTMMANSFRDPFFRAQMQKESAAVGEATQELCLRCHAPMASHGAVLAGGKPPRLQQVDGDLLAEDGVSCTTCHLIEETGLGEPQTFTGHPRFNTKRHVFGPFADVLQRPMQNIVRYTPVHGDHMRKAALCATCHTFYTEYEGKVFAEQTPYLEWRNSQYSDEGVGTEKSRTCQQCHMPKAGPTRIARNPMGFDYPIPQRDEYHAHAFVGGNAFMLDLMRANGEELGISAEPKALQQMAAATREQLRVRTASLSISDIERDGAVATFRVRVQNLAGHKFPTGFPSRRAWLHVRVTIDGGVVFESGALDAAGRLVGVEDEHRLPHVSTVERPGQVVVYEMVAADPDGAPTTLLTKMVRRLKDNRLLPRGWKDDGPHVADTAPVGTDGDEDFTAGGDTVSFRVPLPDGSKGRVQVNAELLYQAVPPLWVDALRAVDADDAKDFVRMYDAAPKAPERVAGAEKSEP